MNSVFTIIKEQFSYFNLIIRLSTYEVKSKYLMHYLGVLWQFLNPAIQVSVFWIIFGIGFRSGKPVDGFDFFPWFVVGIIPWFFINPTIIQGSNSVYKQIKLVSKMKFPISILPSVSIASNAINFLMLLIVMCIILFVNGIMPSFYLVQLPYYLVATFVFLYAVTLLFSTISTIVRDFQSLLQSTMRMLFYLSPILWNEEIMPSVLNNILKLNPLYYIIDGFRNTFLYKEWFYEDLNYTLYFWGVTILLLTIGSMVHIKFKGKFIDYL